MEELLFSRVEELEMRSSRPLTPLVAGILGQTIC